MTMLGYLCVGRMPTGDGRTRLTFLIGDRYRVCTVWGDPPAEAIVARAGQALVLEQQVRPVGGDHRPTLPDAPGPTPADSDPDSRPQQTWQP